MKLLMIYYDRFAYTPADKTLENEPDCHDGEQLEAALIGLIHAESADEEDPSRIEKKLLKNLK